MGIEMLSLGSFKTGVILLGEKLFLWLMLFEVFKLVHHNHKIVFGRVKKLDVLLVVHVHYLLFVIMVFC
ncbi:hypothetical protein Sjap_002157 [Stephania japonica]|uniref:Uncharacterized protein n=1 Tax=Stephania japonica TaxID=461633 RepID=A0AAP0KLA4_9MAGN